MKLGSRGLRRRALYPAALLLGAWVLAGVAAPAGAAPMSGQASASGVASQYGRAPDLAAASAYLVAAANLVDGHYYESFPRVADFGLTIDGALALAATRDQRPALRKIVAFIATDGKDAAGHDVDYWTGIGTAYASGGAIGKEALLAEVAGDNPRHFGGHDLVAALDASVCPRASAPGQTACPAAGSYRDATSVFDQALGLLAQLRAGQVRQATAPVAYLESLQRPGGGFPSLIPASGGADVDSTAMAVMGLALARGQAARAAVSSGLSWIAGQQAPDGGFPSAGADSVNSAGLAIQALTLRAADYTTRIRAARAFLAREQNRDGGFSADAGQHGSNLRASAQAAGGATGVSFGTLRRALRAVPVIRPAGSLLTGARVVIAVAVLAVLVAMLLGRRRRSRRLPAAAGPPRTRSQVGS